MSQESTERKTPWWRRPVVIGTAVTVVLVAAMVASTTFVSTDATATAADSAVEYADENFEAVVVPAIAEEAQPLPTLVADIVADPDAAGEEYGSREAEGKPWSYAATVTGTVTEGEFGEIGLEVDGMPEGITVGVAVPPFGSNTAIRDAGTDVAFGDFINQTEFQKVAIELNKRAVESVYGNLDPKSLAGKDLTVTGAFTWVSNTGGDIDHVTVVPVKIEPSS
jgi:predicted lipoprotein